MCIQNLKIPYDCLIQYPLAAGALGKAAGSGPSTYQLYIFYWWIKNTSIFALPTTPASLYLAS
jgi:hypothetical protein